MLLLGLETCVDIWMQMSIKEQSRYQALYHIFLMFTHKSIHHQWLCHAQWLSEYTVWIKMHAAQSSHPRVSHTERQTLYCTILTIDFIIIFSSAPASPCLIFTTGTSITLMACKNQPAGGGCQTLAFERKRAKQTKKTKKQNRVRKEGWERMRNKEIVKEKARDKFRQIYFTWGQRRGWLGLGMQEGGEEEMGRGLRPCKV